MASFGQRSAVPVSKVELRIQANNLIDKDVTSKSDPCAVLKMHTDRGWYEVGRTENIKNCLSPQFVKTFEIDYYFEEVQKLKFEVFDIDNKTPQLDDDDYLGGMECTLGQVVSGSPFTRPLVLRNNKPAGRGTISITSEELQGLNDVLNLNFHAQRLDKKDLFGKSDPYLEFSRQAPNGQWQVVFRTEVVKNNLNPRWRPLSIKVQKLCAGDMDKTIRVSCFDYDSNDDPDLIGHFDTTVNQLKDAVDRELSWPCINPKKKAKKSSYKDSGIVVLDSCKLTKEHSFLDFIYGGLQINFTVGIDFTASNGDPRTAQSLHYINPYKPNQYVHAIQSVGAVIQDYDSDQMFPALGFGARIPPNMQVSHEFAINFNPQNPFCAGIQGIVGAYQNCISQVQLYGPTNFSPLIYHIAKFGLAAQQEQGAKNYFVLLILTDGVITDMDATREAIVYASQLPVSIIIVGVGGADFEAMEILDGDDGVLRAPSGKRVARDIVQFVPFRDFVNAPFQELAKHVLAEVPKQVTDYYKMRGISPAPPRPPPPYAGASAEPGAPPPPQ